MGQAHRAGGLSNTSTRKPRRLVQRVYGDDVDGRGQLSLAATLRFMDRGRVETIEGLGDSGEFASWLQDYHVTVYRIDGRCLGQAGLGENVEILTEPRRMSSHRTAFDQQVRTASGDLVFDAVVECLFLSHERELVPVPDSFPMGDQSRGHSDLRRRKVVEFGPDSHFSFPTVCRVYFEDTDTQGVTYHGAYARFLQRAFEDIIAAAWPNVTLSDWLNKHQVGPSRLDIRYARASRLGDWLEVRTGLRSIDGNKLALDHRIVDRDTREVVADGIVDLKNLTTTGDESEFPRSIVDPLLKILPPVADDLERPRRRRSTQGP